MKNKSTIKIYLACILFLALSSAAFAQEVPVVKNTDHQQAAPVYRDFALGVTALKEHGFGLLGRYRINHFALDFAGGFGLAVLKDSFSGKTKVKFPYQVDLGCSFFFNDEKERFQFGMKLAGLFNQAMGFGGILGGVGELASGRFALNFSAGLMYLPQYKSYMKDYLKTTNVKSTTGLGGGVEIYFGASALIYVF